MMPTTHSKLRSKIIRVGLVDLFPTCQDMLELFVITLMYRFLERVGSSVFVGFECCEVLSDLFVAITR